MIKLFNVNTIIGILFIMAGIVLYISKPPIDKELLNLNINRPSQQVLDVVAPISKLVTDPTDRGKLAIFNQEFANRVVSYNADVQQINDVYVLAAGAFFKETMNNKYENLDIKIVDLFERITSEDNHKLSQQELNKVSEYFLGFSWSLVNN